MRPCVACALALFGAALAVSAARADVPPPVPPAKKLALKVEVDENAKESKLLLPQAAIFTPRGRPVPIGPKGELNADRDAVGQGGPSPIQWAAAGIALTLALTMGGLWLVRRRPSGRSLALLLAAGGTLAAAGILWGNPAVPPRPRPEPQPASLPVVLEGQVQFQVVQFGTGGDAVRLVLTRADYEKLTKAPMKPAQ